MSKHSPCTYRGKCRIWLSIECLEGDLHKHQNLNSRDGAGSGMAIRGLSSTSWYWKKGVMPTCLTDCINVPLTLPCYVPPVNYSHMVMQVLGLFGVSEVHRDIYCFCAASLHCACRPALLTVSESALLCFLLYKVSKKNCRSFPPCGQQQAVTVCCALHVSFQFLYPIHMSEQSFGIFW